MGLAEKAETAALLADPAVRWRTVYDDSESASTIAPVCPDPIEHVVAEDGIDQASVYDCCPHPHIEVGSVALAARIVDLLNGGDLTE